MKRSSVQLAILFAFLLTLSWAVSPATARPLSGNATITTSVLEIPPNPPDGGDRPLITDLKGDPDDLLGGNLSVSEPVSTRKPGDQATPTLWKSFLQWIQSSFEQFSLLH